MRYLLLLLLLINVGCKTNIMTADNAKINSLNANIKLRAIFLNKLLTEIIPSKSELGYTSIWLLHPEYYNLPLNSNDALILIKYGYKVEMCMDNPDRIAYVKWD